MYNADRTYETTTTSGAITTNSTITLGGAYASNYQTFQSRVKVGDPCHVMIVDANSVGWITFEGTLTNATTLTINTIEDSSAGLGTGITLSAGTHKVFLSLGAFAVNKRLSFADRFIDFAVPGGLVWTAAAGLNGNMSAGQAYVAGQRVVKGSVTNHAFAPSTTTYVDLDNTGTLTYTTSSALTANSIRLAKVVSGVSTITSIVQDGSLDSAGNVLCNRISAPTCSVYHSTTQSIPLGGGFLTFDTEEANNDGMHSTAVNADRITAVHAGWYAIGGTLCPDGGGSSSTTNYQTVARIYKNGATIVAQDERVCPITSWFPVFQPNGQTWLDVGDRLQLYFWSGAGVAQTMASSGGNVPRLRATRIG